MGADALERLVLGELQRLCDQPQLTAEELPGLLHRLELRPSDTQLVLNPNRVFGLDHPELALEDLRARLAPSERVVQETGRSPALRILLPRRMQLRGGRTWILVDGASPRAPKVDPALVEALRRAHRLIEAPDAAPASPYDRKLVMLALLAPAIQQDILTGTQPPRLTLADLIRWDAPLSWPAQMRWWRSAG